MRHLSFILVVLFFAGFPSVGLSAKPAPQATPMDEVVRSRHPAILELESLFRSILDGYQSVAVGISLDGSQTTASVKRESYGFSLSIPMRDSAVNSYRLYSSEDRLVRVDGDGERVCDFEDPCRVLEVRGLIRILKRVADARQTSGH